MRISTDQFVSIPKGTSFEHLTHKEIVFIEYRLNHRPRKSLGWKTPHKVFHENLKKEKRQEIKAS